VNPEKCGTVNFDLATDFITWLVSPETQQLIADFKHPSGEPLFVPDSTEWKASRDVTVIIGDETKTFTLAELEAFPKVTLEDIEFTGHKKGPLGMNTWTGASLKDVLLAVDPTISAAANDGKMIVATATDGWESQLRWNQLFGTPGGGEALADSYGCTECHGMFGEGGKRGDPALAGNSSGFGLIKAVIRTEGAHGSIKPFTEEQLSDDELKAIMAWFKDMDAPSEGFMVPAEKQVTLLAYEKNGKAMNGDDGLIQMVMGMDKYTSRFAHWVKTIEVK